jgi:cytochrome c-type biogenesis protein
MSPVALGLAILAGMLSALSPCVLPLLPLVFGAAASEHRGGPALLALGATVAFVAIGLFVATIGFVAGFDAESFRPVGAVVIAALGLPLLFPDLGARLAAAAGPLSGALDGFLRGRRGAGALGQFGLGLALGAIWSPCVGPTLGAASALAARGENLRDVAATMTAFGIGAGLPLLALGFASRGAMSRWRGRLAFASGTAKRALGALLVALGALILLGLDKRLEAKLVALSPEWLTQLTTRY